jgi:hypothetical protein
MKPKLILTLLTKQRQPGERGSVMVAGILVVLALLVGTLGVVAVVNGSKLASLSSGEGTDTQAVAETGADQIIATFNQPENRQLLVAGSTPPNQWSTTNESLQSPCLDTTKANATKAFPSAQAIALADGKFRNLDNLQQVNQGTRRFALRAVRYSTGEVGSADRRTIYRTFAADGTALSRAGVIPEGITFNTLLNLDDPDGGGELRPGTNTGFIAVTVEGRVYRPDGTFSRSTITKEFEVVPKCCGGSFGSNASGGSPTGTATPGALGADSRFCGIDFGMITGINNGRIFSFAANDRYTRRNSENEVVNINSIVGIIDDKSYVWDRGTSRVVNDVQVGCRTFPSACNTSAEFEPGTTNRLDEQYASIKAGSPRNCLGNFGDSASIAGRAASCIPIVPLFLDEGLPSISSKYTYNWTTPNTQAVSQQVVSSGSEQGYPVIRASGTDQANIWIRGNGATGVNQVAPGPFLEYCNTKYLPGNACSSVFNGSNVHGWAVISQSGVVTGGIGDDFASDSLTGRTAGSTPRWTSIWQTSARTGGGGELQLQSGAVTFRRTSTTDWNNLTGTTANPNQPAPAIARAVNLYALKTPVLEFTFTRTGGPGNPNSRSALKLDYSFASPITTDSPVLTNNGWVELATITGGGTVATSNGATGSNCTLSGSTYTCRIAFPPAAYQASNRFSHFVKFRLKANDQYITSTQTTADRLRTVTIDNIAIKSSTAGADPEYLNWCEYSSTFPDTATFRGGFHCLGPTINLATLGNNLRVDTTDHSISFYYNRPTDVRGITFADPLINLAQGASMVNVSCSRGANPQNTVPTENCKTLVSEFVFNPVAEYDRFNIFGRETSPANNCFDSGQSNQPCNQVIVISADGSANSASRSRIAGAWFYLPWGYVSFCVNGCGDIPSISAADFALDDSWNFGGRIWVRTIHNGGQAHFRVPPSPSATLAQLVGAANSSQISYIGWEGIDWVARSPTGLRREPLD